MPLTISPIRPYTSNIRNRMSQSKSEQESAAADRDLYSGLIRLHVLQAEPHAWVGQTALELASAPTLSSRGLEPRRTVLRAFLVARGESYMAMPGGLTRAARTATGSSYPTKAGR